MKAKRVRLILRSEYEGKYLFPLFRRIDKGTQGQWSGWEFLKGGIEKNEKSIDAGLREYNEETGLNYKLIKDAIIKLNIPANVIVRRGKNKGNIELIDTYFADMPYIDPSLFELDKQEHDLVEYFNKYNVVLKLADNLKKNIVMDFIAFKYTLNKLGYHECDSFMDYTLLVNLQNKISSSNKYLN